MAKAVGLQYIESKTVQKMAVVVAIFAVVLLLLKAYQRWQIKKGRTIGNNKSNLSSGKDYNAIARRLYSSMSGFVTWFQDAGRTAAFNAYMALNDDEFIEVYNIFGDISANDNDGTLRNWLSDEVLYGELANIRDSIIARMDLLNLP
jgi:hypothetical protein